MSDELTEELDSSNQSETDSVNTEEAEVETPAEDTEDLEALQEKNKRLFERAKKAEAEAKLLKAERLKGEEKAKLPPEKQGDLTPKDLYALMDAKVPQSDVDEVQKAAKLLGKSIPEALEDNLVKARLSQLAEERRSSEVANTSGSKRTTSKLSDDTLLDMMSQGKVDESDESIARLVDARINARKKK